MVILLMLFSNIANGNPFLIWASYFLFLMAFFNVMWKKQIEGATFRQRMRNRRNKWVYLFTAFMGTSLVLYGVNPEGYWSLLQEWLLLITGLHFLFVGVPLVGALICHMEVWADKHKQSAPPDNFGSAAGW